MITATHSGIAPARFQQAGPDAEDADAVRAWLTAGKDVYVYYNNSLDGHAVDNAQQLRGSCGQITRAAAT